METEKFDMETDKLCPFSFLLYFRFMPSCRFYVTQYGSTSSDCEAKVWRALKLQVLENASMEK